MLYLNSQINIETKYFSITNWNLLAVNQTHIDIKVAEKKPKDPTIEEKFNSYHFAYHKEEVIELIRKVTTVSTETMKIISQMESEKE